MNQERVLAELRERDNNASVFKMSTENTPGPWGFVFENDDRLWNDRARRLWQSTAWFLKSFLVEQARTLVSVLPVMFKGTPHVVYDYGEHGLFVGGLPIEDPEVTRLRNAPPLLHDFYRELHNGYVSIWGDAMGPLPIAQLFTLGDDEFEWNWGPEEEIRKFEPLTEKLVVLANGGGGYLCINTRERLRNTANGIVWWDDERPEESPFAPTLDAWMKIGLGL